MRKSPVEMETGLSLALMKIGRHLETDAKREHRYKRKSGSLQRSTGGRVFKTKEGLTLLFGLGFDPTRASKKYEERIHEGFGAWQPDQFIYNSTKKNINYTKEEIEKAIKKVIKKV
jgi:hypothetical protein